MGKNNSEQTKYIRREYVDTDGWHVTEITGPYTRTILKMKGTHFVCNNNGSVYSGLYAPKLFNGIMDISSMIEMDDEELDNFIKNYSKEWDNKFFSNNDESIIDLIEDPKSDRNSYNYIPISKESESKRWRCGCGCLLLFVVLFVLITSGILGIVGDAVQAIVQYLM